MSNEGSDLYLCMAANVPGAAVVRLLRGYWGAIGPCNLAKTTERESFDPTCDGYGTARNGGWLLHGLAASYSRRLNYAVRLEC
jgi:hypothetical protein